MKKIDPFKLTLEINSKFIDPDKYSGKIGNVSVMMSPLELDEDYYQFRVKVHEDQEIIGFPKFGLVGIGFAKEDDWNTNLPSSSHSTTIFNHIKINKRYASIPDARCIKAIEMIQKVVKEYKQAETESVNIIVISNEPMLKSIKSDKIISMSEFKSNCHIVKKRKPDTFSSSFSKQTYQKSKYCMLFGLNKKTQNYKYKFTFYDFDNKKAIYKFFRFVRLFNIQGEVQTNDRFDKFETGKFLKDEADREIKGFYF